MGRVFAIALKEHVEMEMMDLWEEKRSEVKTLQKQEAKEANASGFPTGRFLLVD